MTALGRKGIGALAPRHHSTLLSNQRGDAVTVTLRRTPSGRPGPIRRPRSSTPFRTRVPAASWNLREANADDARLTESPIIRPRGTRAASPSSPAHGSRAALERPAPTARRLHQPEHPPGVLRGAPPPRRLARRPAARGRHPWPRYLGELHDQGRAPASAATAVAAACFRTRRPGRPSPAGGTDGPGPRRLPADGRQSRTGASAAVRGGGLGRHPRHLPPTAPARPRPRVGGGRPRARLPRRGDRRAPLHGGDAPERGERASLGRRRRRGRRRRGARHRPPREDEPGGRDEGRPVREGRRRRRGPDAAGGDGARGRASCRRFRRRWWACGSRRRPAPAASSR